MARPGIFFLISAADCSPMTIRPEKAQFWDGVLWSAAAVEVTPDETGRFVVGLPPGVYQVEMATWTGRIVVPDGVQAVAFADVVQSGDR